MTTGSNEELRGRCEHWDGGLRWQCVLDEGHESEHTYARWLEAALPKSSPAPARRQITASDLTQSEAEVWPEHIEAIAAAERAKSSPDALRDAAKRLAEACAADFEESTCEDEEKVSYPEKDCHITFGHIRNVFRALAAPSSPIERETAHILKEVCDIIGVKLGPGLARYAPLIARVRELVHQPQVGPVSPEEKR